MCVLIDGVTAGCQAYLQPPRPLSPPLLFLPPIALFHPRLIWQRRRRRAGARVTKGHCSSSNITLMPLVPHLVTLSLYFALTSLSLPARPVPPPRSFVSVLTSPASLVFLPLGDGAWRTTWVMQDTLSFLLFCAPHFFFFFCQNSSTLNVFFFFCI